MKISAILRTVHFRGDHAADAGVAFDLLPAETVEHLIERVMGKSTYIAKEYEWIELRIIAEAK